MKKVFRSVLCIALALALCAGLGVTAFAADVLEGTAQDPAKASISKELKIAENVTCPTETFTFVFTQVTDEAPEYESDAATIPNATVAFTAADKPTNGSIIKSCGNIFDGASFPHAGIYKFTVAETAGSTTDMTYATETYTVEVGIANGTTGTYVYYVKVTDGDGAKVDPTYAEKTGTVTGEEGDPVYTGNGFRFVNTYEKQTGDEETPALSISKTVEGNLGNKTDLDFNFTLTLTADTNAPAAGRTYTYKIGTETGSITTGTPATFCLKHGETLVIETMYAGTQFVVSEAGTALYQAKVVTTGTSADGTVEGTAVGAGVESAIAFISEDGGSAAAFTNTRSSTPPTGVVINSLPYIALVCVAATGLCMIPLARRRREQED